MSRATKGWEWGISKNAGSDGYSYEAAQLSVLMDLRDELKSLNALLNCPNFIGIPTTLRIIARHVERPKVRRITKRQAAKVLARGKRRKP